MAGQKKRGGRRSGTPNLKRDTKGNYINANNIRFTPEEKQNLERLTRKVTRIRNRQLAEMAKLPREDRGKPTGQNVSGLMAMGKEPDFVLRQNTASLQRFTTKKQYNDYIRYLEKKTAPTYIDDRTRLYKRNYMRALENAYGDEAKDIIMKVRMMKPEKFREMITKNELLEIKHIYPLKADDTTEMANDIRASFGMKLKEG